MFETGKNGTESSKMTKFQNSHVEAANKTSILCLGNTEWKMTSSFQVRGEESFCIETGSKIR